jgi:hypothetical protein
MPFADVAKLMQGTLRHLGDRTGKAHHATLEAGDTAAAVLWLRHGMGNMD